MYTEEKLTKAQNENGKISKVLMFPNKVRPLQYPPPPRPPQFYSSPLLIFVLSPPPSSDNTSLVVLVMNSFVF